MCDEAAGSPPPLPAARGRGVGIEPAQAPPAPEARVTAAVPRSRTLAWLRRFAKLWGFALFCIFIVYTFREVALPFMFAILVAYILAPVVDRFERVKIRGKP